MRKRSMLREHAACGGAGALLGLLLVTSGGCAVDHDVQQDSAQVGELGKLALALTVEDRRVESVELSIHSEGLEPPVSRVRVLDVADEHATVSALEGGLLAGTYSLALAATVVDDPQTEYDESAIGCRGEVGGVVVEVGQTTQVQDVVLLCTKDGGKVQRSGSVELSASLAFEEINACGDLLETSRVAPLSTSVGGRIALSATPAPGAAVTWAAEHGNIAADGSSFICPEVPGSYTLQAKISDSEGCSEVLTQEVECRSAYTGECGELPAAFAMQGSCGQRSPCMIAQDGCRWEANCRGRSFWGEGVSEDSFPFVDLSGAVCSATLVDGELVGVCEAEGGASCDFNTMSQPPKVPYCAQLGGTVMDMTACGHTYEQCDVVQDGCSYQANCGGDMLTGSVVEDELQWNVTVLDNDFRCSGPLSDGEVQGSCTQRGRGIAEPLTCDDYGGTVPLADLGACEASINPDGFVLTGCGFDGIHFAAERGCVWSIKGPLTANGVATESNRYTFETETGQRCQASVVDGALMGSCQSATESCEFHEVTPARSEACFQMPKTVASNGCGGGMTCTVLQDGCEFAASCRGGLYGLAGDVTATGVVFPGITPVYTCVADVNEDGTALLGDCTRPNEDGSVSNCRDLTDQQAANLVISLVP